MLQGRHRKAKERRGKILDKAPTGSPSLLTMIMGPHFLINNIQGVRSRVGSLHFITFFAIQWFIQCAPSLGLMDRNAKKNSAVASGVGMLLIFLAIITEFFLTVKTGILFLN